MAESIKVIARFRGSEKPQPSTTSYVSQSTTANSDWRMMPDGKSLQSPTSTTGNSLSDCQYTFDSVLDSEVDQDSMYNKVAKDNVTQLMNGYNVTIFAYGQSGSGKTYTMLGPDSVIQAITGGNEVPQHIQQLYGVIPRAIFQIFHEINKTIQKNNTHFKLRINYFEIYNESLNDLLAQNPTRDDNLKLREQKDGSLIVVGANTVTVTCPEDIFELLMVGQRHRAVASTQINERSSRSHTIFVVEVIQTLSDGAKKSGRLNLVDLAGSERISKTGATGKTLVEAQKINLSLTTLGLCIKQLTDGSQFVNFRDSKLTYFLKESLGGNSKTTLVCTTSKQMKHLEESIQTLKFAQRAKKIKNVAISNVQKSPKELEMMIVRLKQEVSTLKQQLTETQLTQSPNDIPNTVSSSKYDFPTELNRHSDNLQDLTMKITEVETSYDHYRERTELEIIELRAQLRNAQENKETEDELRSQIFFLKFAISTKDEEMLKVKQKHSDSQKGLKEEVSLLNNQIEVKDHLLRELEQEIERMWARIDHLDDTAQKELNTSFEIRESTKQVFLKMKSEVDQLVASQNFTTNVQEGNIALGLKLQLSEFYQKFSVPLDSWPTVNEFDEKQASPWQSQLFVACNKMLGEHLSKLQVILQSNFRMTHMNDKLLAWVEEIAAGQDKEQGEAVNQLKSQLIGVTQQVKEMKQEKKLQERNMNNQKFTIKNLEFESRKKVQEITDKMLKLETLSRRQKNTISKLELSHSEIDNQLSLQKTELNNYKLLQSKTIANAIQNIQERKKKQMGFYGYMSAHGVSIQNQINFGQQHQEPASPLLVSPSTLDMQKNLQADSGSNSSASAGTPGAKLYRKSLLRTDITQMVSEGLKKQLHKTQQHQIGDVLDDLAQLEKDLEDDDDEM